MNFFNRVLVLLLSLLALGAAGIVLLLAAGLLAPEQLAGAPAIRDLLAPLARPTEGGRGQTITIALAVILGSLLLIVLELMPGRQEKRLLLKQDDTGAVTVALDGVRELARMAAGRVEGVREARADLTEDARGLHVRLRVSVDPDLALPELAHRLQEQVKSAVEHHLGRPVADVHIESQATPLEARRRAPRVR